MLGTTYVVIHDVNTAVDGELDLYKILVISRDDHDNLNLNSDVLPVKQKATSKSTYDIQQVAILDEVVVSCELDEHGSVCTDVEISI